MEESPTMSQRLFSEPVSQAVDLTLKPFRQGTPLAVQIRASVSTAPAVAPSGRQEAGGVRFGLEKDTQTTDDLTLAVARRG